MTTNPTKLPATCCNQQSTAGSLLPTSDVRQHERKSQEARAPRTGVGAERVLICRRSGLPLAKITALCSNGWPLLQHDAFSAVVHPIYNVPLDKLLLQLRRGLDEAESAEFMLVDAAIRELGLLMSAVMYNLEAIWQPSSDAMYKQEPSLPGLSAIIGGGSRLLALASWYHLATSKRLEFPWYRISTANSNLKWENYKLWLDAAFEVKVEWEEGRQELDDEETLRVRTDALHTVTAASIYKRVDFAKVWNWIDIQLVQDGRYAPGRRTTFQSLFMKGDSSPEDWTLDDVEDLQLAILECCDSGNEITFFIRTRLEGIKSMISDFYSSFTMISPRADLLGKAGGSAGSCDLLDTHTEQEATFYAGFDRRVGDLEALPPVPVRADYASLGLFLKAQAVHNILSRRYDLAKRVAAKPEVAPFVKLTRASDSTDL